VGVGVVGGEGGRRRGGERERDSERAIGKRVFPYVWR